MIKYLVQHKITKCFRIAFRITHISDENKYLKEKYNFLTSACDVGKFLIVDEGTGIHFVLSGYAFYEGYDIVKRTVMYPAISFAKSGDEVESEIDKRREMLHENICDWWTRNMMNSVNGAPSLHTPVYSDTDAHFCYPYLLSGYDIRNMCGSNMIRHLDIREQKKEKNTMYGKSKTINFCVKKVIFNGPATIVIWGDGTKTVVKCADGDSYSKWAGFAMCIAKRLYGDDFHHQFRHFCGVEDDIPKKEYHWRRRKHFRGVQRSRKACMRLRRKPFESPRRVFQSARLPRCRLQGYVRDRSRPEKYAQHHRYTRLCQCR